MKNKLFSKLIHKNKWKTLVAMLQCSILAYYQTLYDCVNVCEQLTHIQRVVEQTKNQNNQIIFDSRNWSVNQPTTSLFYALFS